MTDTAKSQPPRHRAAPRLVPQAVLFLAGILGSLGLVVPAPYSRVLGATALLISLTWFIQRWRRAGYAMTVGATQEPGESR